MEYWKYLKTFIEHAFRDHASNQKFDFHLQYIVHFSKGLYGPKSSMFLFKLNKILK